MKTTTTTIGDLVLTATINDRKTNVEIRGSIGCLIVLFVTAQTFLIKISGSDIWIDSFMCIESQPLATWLQEQLATDINIQHTRTPS